MTAVTHPMPSNYPSVCHPGISKFGMRAVNPVITHIGGNFLYSHIPEVCVADQRSVLLINDARNYPNVTG